MKRIFLKCFLILAFLLVFTSADIARAAVYYDYSPDPWRSERFAGSTASILEQVFQPRENIMLEGFDFWLDNTGASGNLSFTLSDSLGSVLATKTVSLSSISQIPGGSIVHADLSSPVELSPTKTYSIRMSSYPSGLGVYYANVLTTFLTHNEVHISEYVLGRARVNGVDQEFTFKYAIHGYEIEEDSLVEEEESVEEELPDELIISGAHVSALTGSSATLSWSTNMAADSGVTAREQLNPLYIISSAYDDTMELEHSITLTGLKPDFLYLGDIYSTNSDGETVSTFTLAFRTLDEVAEEEAEEETPVDEEVPQVDEEGPIDEEVLVDGDPEEGDGEIDDGILADSDGDGEIDFDPSEGTPVEDPSPPEFIDGGSGDGNFSISWEGLGGDATSSGYRVDVFDSENNLVKQFFLGPDEKLQEIAGLANGSYTVIVYSEEDGVYTKIALSDFVVSEGSGATLKWALIGFGPVLIIALLVWLVKRRKELPSSSAGA